MTSPKTIADALISARASGGRSDAALLPSPTYDQAIAVQELVAATLGPIGGFKVAKRADGPPVIAPIPAAKVVRSGASIPVTDKLGVELEVGMELISDPSPDMMADPSRHFRPCIVLEIVDTRLTGADDNAMLKLADMQINDGLVVGPSLEDWDGSDFGEVTASLRCGENTVIDGKVTVPGGSALSNLALFCDNVGDHCGGLQIGQIVITGSVSGLAYFPAGTAVEGRINGFGTVSCHLA